LAFSSKTHRVAAHGVTDGTKLWALEEGGFKTLATLQPPSKEPVHALEFSPNGGELLIARTTSIHLWDVGTKQPLKTIVTGHKVAAIESVSFSPDGKRVVTTAWDTTARVSNLETGKEVCKFEGHGAMITGATFLPDGMQVVSAGVDGTLRVWDADNAKELGKLDGKPKVPMRLPVLSADGKRVVAAADDGTVYVWDVAARRESHRFIVKNPLVGRRKLALSPDGTLLAVLSSDWQKAELLLLDLKTGQERGRFVGKEYSTYALSFVDAHTIIGTGADGAIRLWRIEDLDTRPGDTVDSKPPVTEGPKPTDPPRKPLPALLRHHGPKAAVPDDAALAAAEKALKKEHEAEYARKQPEEVRALGEKVLLQGLDPKATLPSRYVALREARDLAASVGDLLVGLRAAEEMENRFNVRLAETKAPVLEKAGAAATSPAVRTSIAFYAASLTDDAVEDNDYATADRLVKIAQANLEKGAVGPVVDAIQARATEVAELRKAYEGVADAIRTVAAKPNDPDANLKLGKFYALQKGDWERGLPHLKRGSDAKLKALAETDWTMGRDTKPMEALADSYAEHGQTETGTAKTNLLLRACYWYGRSQLGRSGEEQNEILRKSHALESTVPLPRPVILCAWYGAFATWANVTDVIRFRMLQSPPQTKEFKIPPQELGGDLSPGDEKTLFVVYRYRGWVHLDTKPLISETPGGKPDKFIFSPVPTSALSDSFRPAPGQELHILHASLIKGGQAQFFGNKAQAQVKGATLKAKAADVGFNAGVRNEHQAYVIVYHDGTRVQLFMAPCSQDINIAAATSDTKPPGTESPIVTDTPRKPLPPLVKHSGPRVAVPDEAAVTAAESKVKKDHEAEYASEKPAEIRALAEKLLQQGLAQPAPAVRYVMLRDARDLAAANGDLPVAMRAADEVANQFRAKVAEVKAVALEKAAKANLAPDAQEALALAALGAADDAEEDDDYATAERLVKIAQNAVAAQGGGPLAQGVEVRAKEVAEVRKAYEKVTDAVRTLATKPKDPDANLAVGRFYALEKGDWDRGWHYLGRGSDAKLKDLVHSELTIKRDYKARLALADRFSAQAEGESGAAKTHLLLRVACWQMIARSAYFEKDIPDWVDKAYKLEQSLPPSRAVILEARYGAGKSWVDVTDTVRQATVKQPKPRSVTLFHPEDFGSDPAPAEEKTLVVLYRYRGSSHLAIKFARPEKPDSETKVFMFNPLWENTYPYLDLNPPSLGQEIIILDGELCGGGQSAYMGHTAQTLVKGAVLKAKAGDLCAMGSPERFKAVVLAYHDGHRVRLSVTLASDPLLIDAQAGKP
jgi:WD40 repeat protein